MTPGVRPVRFAWAVTGAVPGADVLRGGLLAVGGGGPVLPVVGRVQAVGVDAADERRRRASHRLGVAVGGAVADGRSADAGSAGDDRARDRAHARRPVVAGAGVADVGDAAGAAPRRAAHRVVERCAVGVGPLGGRAVDAGHRLVGGDERAWRGWCRPRRTSRRCRCHTPAGRCRGWRRRRRRRRSGRCSRCRPGSRAWARGCRSPSPRPSPGRSCSATTPTRCSRACWCPRRPRRGWCPPRR